MKNWQKKLNIGKTADGINVTIEVELKLKEKTDPNKRTTNLEPVPAHYPSLSISGEGNNGHAFWGQVQDTIRAELNTMDLEIDREKLLRILEIWDSLHLNDVTAVTERQEEAIKKHYEKNKRRYRYEDACEVLKRANLYEDRGYKYGHSWLLRVLPEKVIKEVRSW